MGRNLASLLAGLMFGFGLALSGMTHPQKVLNFLDVTGAWDASLLFVLGGAVGVTLVSFRFILQLNKPMLAERFVITRETHIDRNMILGAILFGIGWGISGYCPGPAIALIAAPNWELLAFLPAAILGAVAEKYLELHSQPAQANRYGASITPKHESTCACRFPHPIPLPKGEGGNESLRDFHANQPASDSPHESPSEGSCG